MDLAAIPAFADHQTFHVVIESPRGSALKLKYEPRWQAMTADTQPRRSDTFLASRMGPGGGAAMGGG